MTIETGLVAELLGNAGVSAIVGSNVFHARIPQNADLPAIVYTQLSTVRQMDMSGPAPFVTVRFQIDCWHTSTAGMRSLADAVRVALNGAGIASPKLLGSEPVQLVFLDNETDLSEFEGDQKLMRLSQDWLISYLEE